VVPGMAPTFSLGVARHFSGGGLEAAFGVGGVADSEMSGVGDDAAVQENGRIVVAGRGGAFLTEYPLLWRAQNDGTPDAGFLPTAPPLPGSPQAFFTAVALQPDGKIVAVGRAGEDAEAFLVARYHGDGTDLIFKDGFDLGFSAWSGSSTGLANLFVDPAAQMAGGPVGLRAYVDDLTPLYVQDDSPNDEDRYRARFYLDAVDFDPGEDLDHRRVRTFIVFSENPGRRLAAVVLRRVGGAYAVMGRARRDDNSQADTGWAPIAPGAHRIELDLKRSSTPDANDGWFRFWVDGTQIADLSGIDNNRSAVDFVRLGALSLKGGASGTLFWDTFESRRQDEIVP
jgi:beta-propeller uncharacterized protein DUF5122